MADWVLEKERCPPFFYAIPYIFLRSFACNRSETEYLTPHNILLLSFLPKKKITSFWYIFAF